jgi:transposase
VDKKLKQEMLRRELRSILELKGLKIKDVAKEMSVHPVYIYSALSKKSRILISKPIETTIRSM